MNLPDRGFWLRIGTGIALAVASAVLLTLSFPPYGLWLLIWVGFVPMLVAQFRVMPRSISSLASAITIGGWLGGYITPIFAGSGIYMTWLPLIMGVITFFGDRGLRAFHERTDYRWFVCHGVLTWVGIEMIRSFVPIMGTWAFVANTLHGQPWLIQPVSIFSIFGLGLLIMFVNYHSVDKFSELSRQAAQQGAQIIVWPEMAIEGDPQVTNTAEFRQLAGETDAYLVLGYFVKVDERVWRNEATVLTPDGRFLGVYGKDHPVTFAGETSPTRGTYPVYDTPLGKIGTIICYDLDFTDTARKITRNGAQLILVPSHDWPEIATQHYTHLVFRAIENRVAMAKSDNSGNDSVIIDSYGRVIAAAITPGGDKVGQVVVADAPLGTGDTLAVRLGDWTGWIALAGLVFFTIYEPVTKARAKRKQDMPL